MTPLTSAPPIAPQEVAPEQRATIAARPNQSPDPRRTVLIPLLLVVAAAAFYCAATYRIASTKEPFIDEGWFANPAYNLAFHGFMGSSVLEPTGTWLNGELKGIREYTYADMPLDLVVQAGWYRIAGFGLVQMRLLSALWGILALASWYFIVERLTRNVTAGCLAVFLLACDFTFLWSAADGRMDMMCIALGSAALAVYLKLREKNFARALLAANCLAAASVFTHPNGVVWVTLLAALVLLHDRGKLRIGNVAASAVPYLVFLAGWGVYIAKRPAYFLAQFGANLHIPSGTRGLGLLHPLWAFRNEWARYARHFGNALWAAPMPRWALLIPFLLWAVCVSAIVHYVKTRDTALGKILLMLGVVLGFMLFADSLKAENYLSMAMPLYAAVAAVWFLGGDFKGRAPWLRSALLAALLLAQFAVLGKKLSANPMRDQFQPTVAFVKTLGNVQVTADAVFGFGLGYDRLTDDARLGMRSGRKPEVIVTDWWYWVDWWYIFSTSDRPAANYVRQLLLHDYRQVFARGHYMVYVRKDLPAAQPASVAGK